MSLLQPISLYIHFPWCIRKCPYCDFNSHRVKTDIPQHAYVDALLRDLDADLNLLAARPTIDSIFFGGGTPSLFELDALQRLLDGIQQRVTLTTDCEITLEANPGTAESAKFKAFRQLGINRLSLGIQSFDDAQLQALGRIHDANQALHAVTLAQNAGFDRLNLDLMFGLPSQTPEQALADIKQATQLEPEHISYYQLTLEPNTAFHRAPPILPDDDHLALIQHNGQAVLAEAGYAQYEVSAYARNNGQCRHNRNYWQFGDYLGIGAGAHGKLSLQRPDRILRTSKPRHPEQYLSAEMSRQAHSIAQEELPVEFLMNGLRLKAGFDWSMFQQATGLEVEQLEPGLSICIEKGLLEPVDSRLRCTQQGWNFLDSVLQHFLPVD